MLSKGDENSRPLHPHYIKSSTQQSKTTIEASHTAPQINATKINLFKKISNRKSKKKKKRKPTQNQKPKTKPNKSGYCGIQKLLVINQSIYTIADNQLELLCSRWSMLSLVIASILVRVGLHERISRAVRLLQTKSIKK
jgi:hypothetical protein